jgi:hypothetical protein
MNQSMSFQLSYNKAAQLLTRLMAAGLQDAVNTNGSIDLKFNSWVNFV